MKKATITSTDGTINFPYELTKFGKEISREQDLQIAEKTNAVITETITVTRPIVLSAATVPYLNGKLQVAKTTDSSKPFIGVITESCVAGDEKNIISKGIIEDASLTGNVGDFVYVDESSATFITADNDKLAIGRIISLLPTKIYINPTKTFNELNTPVFLNNPDRDLYATLRYISYNMPFLQIIGPQEELSCIAYSNGKIYALTPQVSNTIYTSIDNGLTWQSNFINNNEDWKGIAISDVQFNNGEVIAAISSTGTNRLVLSKDLFFYKNYAINANIWQDIIYVNNYFIAVSSSGTNRILKITKNNSSTNFWGTQLISLATSAYAITHRDGIFVTVGDDLTNVVNRSLDGYNWSIQTLVAKQWTSVAAGFGNFVAVNNSGSSTNRIGYSNDGITWSTTTNTLVTNGDWVKVFYGGTGSYFVALSDYQIIYAAPASPNSWTNMVGVSNSSWRSIARNPISGAYVVVGLGGLDGDKVATMPTDLSSITMIPILSGYGWVDVVFANGIFVALSDTYAVDGIMVSTDDGATWTNGTLPITQGILTKLVTYDDKFYAISHKEILVSDDGLSWSFFLNKDDSLNVYDAIVVNGILYETLNSSQIKMTDLNESLLTKDFTLTHLAAPENNEWVSVAYGDNKLVAVSKTGTNRIMLSTNNGTSWSSVSSPENNTWESIAFGNSLFVAISSDGTNRIMTSPDGTAWTARLTPENNAWKSITFGNGVFFAVSEDGTNRLIYSENGIDWTTKYIPALPWIKITYRDGNFVAINSDNSAPFYIARNAYI